LVKYREFSFYTRGEGKRGGEKNKKKQKRKKEKKRTFPMALLHFNKGD